MPPRTTAGTAAVTYTGFGEPHNVTGTYSGDMSGSWLGLNCRLVPNATDDDRLTWCLWSPRTDLQATKAKLNKSEDGLYLSTFSSGTQGNNVFCYDDQPQARPPPLRSTRTEIGTSRRAAPAGTSLRLRKPIAPASIRTRQAGAGRSPEPPSPPHSRTFARTRAGSAAQAGYYIYEYAVDECASSDLPCDARGFIEQASVHCRCLYSYKH